MGLSVKEFKRYKELGGLQWFVSEIEKIEEQIKVDEAESNRKKTDLIKLYTNRSVLDKRNPKTQEDLRMLDSLNKQIDELNSQINYIKRSISEKNDRKNEINFHMMQYQNVENKLQGSTTSLDFLNDDDDVLTKLTEIDNRLEKIKEEGSKAEGDPADVNMLPPQTDEQISAELQKEVDDFNTKINAECWGRVILEQEAKLQQKINNKIHKVAQEYTADTLGVVTNKLNKELDLNIDINNPNKEFNYTLDTEFNIQGVKINAKDVYEFFEDFDASAWAEMFGSISKPDFSKLIPKLPTLPGTQALLTIITEALKKLKLELKKMAHNSLKQAEAEAAMLAAKAKLAAVQAVQSSVQTGVNKVNTAKKKLEKDLNKKTENTILTDMNKKKMELEAAITKAPKIPCIK